MRVLVCGGRGFGELRRGTPFGSLERCRDEQRVRREKELLRDTLSGLAVQPSVIINGDARGADRLAVVWAERLGIETLPFKANWYPNGRLGGLDRAAGPIRNQRMLDEGKPDLVVAFPGGRGTEDMKRRSRLAGIKVIEVG